jgi:hypothetical protein
MCTLNCPVSGGNNDDFGSFLKWLAKHDGKPTPGGLVARDLGLVNAERAHNGEPAVCSLDACAAGIIALNIQAAEWAVQEAWLEFKAESAGTIDEFFVTASIVAESAFPFSAFAQWLFPYRTKRTVRGMVARYIWSASRWEPLLRPVTHEPLSNQIKGEILACLNLAPPKIPAQHFAMYYTVQGFLKETANSGSGDDDSF